MRRAVSKYLKKCLWLSAHWLVAATAASVAYLVPADRAYAVLWRILSFAFPLLDSVHATLHSPSSKEAWRVLMLRRALAVMTRRRPGFDLPLRVIGEEELQRSLESGAPLILCTAHFGLTLAAPRILADHGRRVVLVAKPSPSANGWHWGLREPLQVLPTGPDVLRQARAALRTGIPLISFVDHEQSEAEQRALRISISPNMFRLAHRVGATILFFASHLDPDGTIAIEFHRPRHDRISTSDEADQCAAEFAGFASARIGRTCVVQRKPGRPESPGAQPEPRAEPPCLPASG